MRWLLKALTVCAFFGSFSFMSGCLFVHEKETKTSGAPTQIEHSQSTSQTEIRDNGMGSSRREVETQHKEVEIK